MQGIVSASKHSLHVAIAALKVPQAAVSAARGSLTVAQGALDGAAVVVRESGRSLHVLKGAMTVAANGVRVARYVLIFLICICNFIAVFFSRIFYRPHQKRINYRYKSKQI